MAQLLQDASILEEVDQSSKHVHQDGFTEDFCDGSRFKTHPYFLKTLVLYRSLHIMMSQKFVIL